MCAEKHTSFFNDVPKQRLSSNKNKQDLAEKP
jgi:hypothetical protein